ncbi:Heme exporter protein C [invertebrate metagenome]|uniref:Heme exporter protein C n=1 Tax=invertebrate metagenome TaxID=1711999 RepID=A0A2H9T9V4_9ZZZZ
MKRIFFHQLGSPRWFFKTTGRWLPWLQAISGLMLCIGLIWGIAFTPADYLQGNSYRIIYIHVPVAFLAQSIYVLMALAGVIMLVWRIKIADMFIASCTPVGASFTLLALLTGSIWGKPTWGTWWVWDARLTSMLILLFLYLGIMALRSALKPKTAAKACSLMVIIGVINIPVIKFSVQWWSTLHQGSTLTLTEKPPIAPEMLWPLLFCIAAFYLFFISVMIARLHNEILARERRTYWVRQLFR